jgi:rRNA small subunit aminocarboxypropyltransferase
LDADLPTGVAPKVYVLLFQQDDPKKCTAARLSRFKLAIPIHRLRQIPRRALVLNPFADQILLPTDRNQGIESGLVAVDCSWERVNEALALRLPGYGRRLPTLLAANPTNYAKPHKLSSVEALAGSLYLLGFKNEAERLLSLFKWGETFLSLNAEPLEAYSLANSIDAMLVAEAQFF